MIINIICNVNNKINLKFNLQLCSSPGKTTGFAHIEEMKLYQRMKNPLKIRYYAKIDVLTKIKKLV